ncbi:hypothetical protein TNCV_2426931 [Trichonephila clavipes]|nr:hypothetical protein TNCV_2426931 [Trichonephila clavipes]
MQVIERFCCGSTPILRENTLGVVRGLSPLFPLHQPHERLEPRRLLRVHPAEKALYIYKHPCLLPDSNPGPTAPQSASPTTIPVGRLKMNEKFLEDASKYM